MAIEIEPAKKESSSRENLFLLFSILILVACFGIYFYLSQFVLAQKQAEALNLSSQLSAMGQEDVQAKESELALAGVFISDFKILLENNPKTSKFFDALQKWVHPKVVYSNLSFDVPARKATMAGQTAGFQNVMQQIALLRQEQTIENYEISNVNLSETGQVSFDLAVTIKEAVLK
jgi:cell division protein FtsB